MPLDAELRSTLQRLSLQRFVSAMEEEAITELSLLKSMGREGLRENLVGEMGLDQAGVLALERDLFGPEEGGSGEEDDELELEDNDGDDLELEENEDEDALELEANEDDGPSLEGNDASAPPRGGGGDAAARATAAAKYKQQGNAALEAGLLSEAVEYYSQAIERDGSDGVFFSNRSVALCRLGRFADALADADAAVRLRRTWAKAHARRGAALSGLGEHDRARAAYATALEYAPGDAHLLALEADAAAAATAAASATAGAPPAATGGPPDASGGEGEQGEGGGGSDWVEELNGMVRHADWLARLESASSNAGEPMAPMLLLDKYTEAVREAIEELQVLDATDVRAAGEALGVAGVAACGVDKIALRAARPNGEGLLLLLRHKVRYADWEEGEEAPERDEQVAASMAESAAMERATLRALGECKAWASLDRRLRDEQAARVGGTRYPCVFVEAPRGRLLGEAISAAGCGAGEEGVPSPALLDAELSAIREATLGAMHALAQAWAKGYAVADGGASGPLPSDVLLPAADGEAGRVLLLRADFLEPKPADAVELNFEPLVFSPLGHHVRAWWVATAERLGIGNSGNGLAASPKHQQVLDQYGALNWLLFGWERERLAAAPLLQLVERGAAPQERSVSNDEFQADWRQLQEEIFHRLGPRHLDELRETLEALSRRELKLQDAVARANYCIGPQRAVELEHIAERYRELLLLV